MTFEKKNPNASSDETTKPELQNQSADPAMSLIKPNLGANPMQLLLQQIGKIGTQQEELARAMQHNDGLLVDAVSNLELRLNMTMAILHDLANGQVKFENRQQHKRDHNGNIDLHFYYEQCMEAQRKAEEEAAAASPKTDKEPEYPQDAVIFGGG